ncbi:hypothetical protein BX616_009123, partial [Lobosporangium transversale]
SDETGFLDLPRDSEVLFTRTTADFSTFSKTTDKLFLPSIPNFPCIDFALGPNKLFQVTVSEKHPIKQAPFKEIIDYITGPCSKGNRSKLKGSDDTIFLYFVVPGYIYDNFKVQKFVINDSQDAKAIPGYLKH